jgi:hypothetical protein
MQGCRNPFFPHLGSPRTFWTDQETVGGLLQNFRNAYNTRDSLRYAECLACPDYQFQFYDHRIADYDWMSREQDLLTTGRLFRHYEHIDLEWSGLDPETESFAFADSMIQVTVFFDLRLDDEYINGMARFQLLKSTPSASGECRSVFYPEKSVFRIVQWLDEN